jgi:hypothetical protein
VKTSYQRRKEEIAALRKEVDDLKKALAAKANVFVLEHRWLGIGQIVLGTVIDGVITEISRVTEPNKP